MSAKAILFLGATGGCALSALRRALAANHTCIAICRTPSKLTDLLGDAASASNLTILAGNAHDEAVLAAGLVHPADPTRTVDVVVSSIGAAFKGVGMDDPNVCEQGLRTLLAAVATLESQGLTGRPRIIAVSSTGVSPFQRDIPVAMVPFYRALVRPQHKDKRAMEQALVAWRAGKWTIVRPSLLVDGPATTEPIRVGVEDPVRGVEVREIGYTIAREDVGRWIFEELLAPEHAKYVSKVVSLTY